ncbi:tungsten formylmethanofuran dehydrogenase [Mesorhizobium sp.]|uniref:tungsten formylmethanofuran dehydrogenase n=1 Tax=Mesorhizobium sp. TaxID=1871066 RepID=UPI000FE59C8B|nr:tungsten formylmethanofuran dehydrogenase [Mesorhizobium sp.]RWK61281.1 MAG: tungsten formylmethanofuran dehydrogenase [Mesorhizobium sp.]RWM45253.1 MAG: tungsten formylmethanofuran dehydrogenase [Mesorhizobium sp.]RWM50943.1 MAG: tungsten formylmethanofuran dehydrogenase [Mesorhizobium sp.]RWM51226.1 MAG: tungsten formylmethanofuran dehydrogenase [Mesorhizobium sp.]RWM96753.1 MAG: tungsten formylmethanofuran dehydrogenase [Mesorhizobium sp.]
MAVAWIGNRETLVERAAAHAAALLGSSRCPVFSLDTDIHGTRAAIALAERVGAAYDHVDGAVVSRETALFTDKGAMTVAPGETRRRADVVVIVGELPQIHHEFVGELSATVPDLSAPDLSAKNQREIFLVGSNGTSAPPLSNGRTATLLSCGEASLGATLAALRAQWKGRQTSQPVSNFDDFTKALEAAHFPVFLFSGDATEGLALEMLQGLITDLNRKSRASGLHLPASENGWGSALASTWMTGFPLRTGFARGFPEFDPWRYDVARMIAAGEADLHLRISSSIVQPQKKQTRKNRMALIALAKTQEPIAGAAVTIAIGEAGVDHEAVVYSGRTGSLRSIDARAASELPSAATVIRLVASHVSAEAALPC